MTPQEHKRQYLVATAKLNQLRNSAKRGKATKEEILDAEKHLAEIMSFQNSVPSVVQLRAVVAKSNVSDGAYLPNVSAYSPEIALLIDNLKRQLAEIDIQKGNLSNQLHTIPDGVNCKSLVRQILDLREEWVKKSDEIYYVMQYGVLPVSGGGVTETMFNEAEFSAALPVDLLELDQKRRNAISNLSKYKSRKDKAKTDIQKIRQEKNIMIAELQISAIERQLTARK